MQKILLITLCTILLTMTACTNNAVNTGNIEEVKTEIKDTNAHNKKDINKVFNMIKEDFKTEDFKDCTLLTIEYTNEFVKLEDTLEKENNIEEAIVVTFKFKTGSNSSEVFNPNSKYTYTAEFIKVDDTWKKINWGQG